jgi:hypothetical protein
METFDKHTLVPACTFSRRNSLLQTPLKAALLHLGLLLVLLTSGGNVSAQARVGLELSITRLWATDASVEYGGDWLRSPALRAEFGLSKHWDLCMGFRYAGAVPARQPSFIANVSTNNLLELPFALRFVPTQKGVWKLGIQGGFAGGVAVRLRYPDIYAIWDGSPLPTYEKPILFSLEGGVDVSRNLGSKFTYLAFARTKWIKNYILERHNVLGASVGMALLFNAPAQD